MTLTREQALRLHREMWTDMQKELGDCPTYGKRRDFKRKWMHQRFPFKVVLSNCFLCEYANLILCEFSGLRRCSYCPINWGKNGELGNFCEKTVGVGIDWRYSPISDILALPEKEETNVSDDM